MVGDKIRSGLVWLNQAESAQPAASSQSNNSEYDLGDIMSNPLNRIHNAFTAQLPLELVDTLNQAYFLHLLATDPGKVIPPGKSLLSMMARSSHMSGDGSVESGTSILHDRVEKVVHQAFWTEVRISF